MSSSSKFFRRLKRSQRGAVAPMFLVTTVLVLGASFGGIDLVRYSVAQGRLQYALDGAALSAGRNLANLTPSPGTPEANQWQTDAFEYFRSNLPNGYMGSDVKAEDLKIVYSEEVVGEKYVTGQFVEMSAKGQLPLISTGYLHVSSLEIGAGNQALRRTRSDLELVMALDNTGSMGWDYDGNTTKNEQKTRMYQLKAAARELSSTVLGASEASGAPGRVFIGLVPFADTVNVGNSAVTQGWLESTPAEQKNFVDNLWMGCITEPRFTAGTDLPAQAWKPSTGFQALRMTLRTTIIRETAGLKTDDNKRYDRILPSTPSKKQPSTFTPTNNANKDRWVATWRSGVDAPGSKDRDADDPAFYIYTLANPSNCNSARQVHFLDEDLATIQTAINSMTPAGSTIVPTGLLWAWRMLHPDWTGQWGKADMPRKPEPKVLSKVIVLLTDGENDPPSTISSSNTERNLSFSMEYDAQRCTNSNFTSGCNLISPSPSPLSRSNFSLSNTAQSPMNSLKMRDPDFDSSRAISTTAWPGSGNESIGWGNSSDISRGSVDNYLKKLCYEVKNDGNGIKIYTVTLGKLSASTKTMLADCSSGAGYTYQADNPEALAQAFKSIAGALTELRLTR